MKIRTIHHLSATGGTVISRGLASMQNVFLLSELNPLSRVGGGAFSPLDPLAQFVARYPDRLRADRNDIFLERLAPVIDAVEQMRGTLVIRDHSHTDWLGPECRGHSALLRALKRTHETQPVVTVRHPLESYHSMTLKGWHEGVGGLDAYCDRQLAFLDHFANTPIFRYEDFVLDPSSTLQGLCEALDIPYTEEWKERFRQVRMSGGSGRASKLPIQPLPVQSMPAELLSQAYTSENYDALVDRLGYTRDHEKLSAERRIEIAQRYGAVNDLVKQLDATAKELEAGKREIAMLRKSIQERDRTILRQKNKIKGIQSSSSWRTTAPLRWIKSHLSKKVTTRT